MNILFEDKYILVCEKPAGLLSEKSESGRDIITEIFNSTGLDVFPVHRLDSGTGGVMVFAKSSDCASKFSSIIQSGKLIKEYLAVIKGRPQTDNGIFEDLLFKDSAKNKSYVVKRERKGVKKASLEYRLLDNINNNESYLSLVLVKLHTGRTHQIRVQFSSRGMPLLGDVKYGSKDERCGVSLWSYRISFLHPYTGKEISCSLLPKTDYPWDIFCYEGI